MKNSLYYTIVIIFLLGCKRVEPPTALKYDYFPLELGKYKTYQMDSVIYDAFAESVDSFHYLTKETVDNQYVDNADDTAYRILIEYSLDSGNSWLFKQYITEKRTIYSGQRVENDLRLVKLIFPIKNRRTWDENEMNNKDVQLNGYIQIDREQTINNILFDSTLTVDQGDEEDPFFRFYGEEIYAKGIGLISKTYINTETQQGKKDGSAYTKVLVETNY